MGTEMSEEVTRSVHWIRARARQFAHLGTTALHDPSSAGRRLAARLSSDSASGQAETAPDGVMMSRVMALFRPSSYTTLNPDVGLNWAGPPVEHYLRYGRTEERDICMLFESAWYRTQFPGLGVDISAIEHYLTSGAAAGADPGPAFDSGWYLRQLGSELPANVTPLEHYVTMGWTLGLDPHPLFSTAWYVERNPNVELGQLTPMEHFLERGWLLDAEPGPMFVPSAYRAINPDVDSANRNPFMHYVRFGVEERRSSSSVFDDVWYVAQAADDPLIRSIDPLSHFVCFGAPIGRVCNPDSIASALAKHRLDADRRSRSSFVGAVVEEPPTNSGSIDWGSRLAGLSVPHSDRPLVSVIVPTHNHSEDVIRCLESIAEAGDSTAFEVILVDDASAESHAVRLRSIDGVNTIRLNQNQGFAGACTAGVAASTGEYIMLLNNDTEVLPGWLDALVTELRDHPRTGVVGSKIVRPDLLLQEAGCIMWSDGSGYQYGSGQSPFDFNYTFRREVDYCSGAALLVRRSIWDEVDGFDDRFSPAYYEDADLCFAARHRGYAVVFEPSSVLFHNEGSSHGTDGGGTKRYQFRNKELFRDKWSVSLLSHGAPRDAGDPGALIRLRDRRRAHHVIVVDHRVPTPDQDAGSLRLVRLMEELIDRGDVVHFLPANRVRLEPWTRSLELMGAEVITGKDEDVARHLAALAAMSDFVVVSRPEIFAQHLTMVLENLPTVPLVFDMVDAHARRLRRSAAMQGRPELEADAVRLERLEAGAARISDVVVAVSKADEDFITDVARIPLRTVCIPTIHYAEPHGPDFDARSGLLFVGGFEHTPNVDAALYLIHDVLPLIRDRIGDVELTLAGSKPPAMLSSLTVKGVTVTGWVPELRPLYDRARLSVAPLRFGAGVKGKIGEALSFGLPTVTTTIGIEGIDVVHGRDILVGDSAEAFADCVAQAYASRSIWEDLQVNGARSIEDQFGRKATNARIDQLLEAVAAVDVRPNRQFQTTPAGPTPGL